ncbi:MAG: hypothetical protein KA275_04310, partial [Chitinophagaceae bacterium]|nr:hypothetical protein [Chitinophagaceae bacterium]
LKSKYKIEKCDLPLIDTSIYRESFQHLDDAPNMLSNISASSILNHFGSEIKNRYALLLIFYSNYNPDYQSHYNAKMGLATTKILVDKKTKPFSDLRLIVMDTLNKEIVFYDNISSSNFDPRLEVEIETMTKKILKKIYYK